MSKKALFFLLTGLGLVLLYLPSFGKYFFGDDFALIKIAQEQNIFSAFNIFERPANSFHFYRPFSVQLFWLTGWTLFGLYPLGYHLIVFSFFLLSVYLAYILARELFKNEKTAMISTFFYAFASSHFYRLYYLTQFQEVSFAVFTFATLILFLKRNIWTPVFFILALTTKETAVMIVPFMLIYTFFTKTDRKKLLHLLYYCAGILIVYILARLFIFGFAQGGYYTFSFGPKQVLNNILWYGLWSLGLPEDFVNVKLFQLPTIINPLLFKEFEIIGNITLGLFASFIASLIIPFRKLLTSFNKTHLILIGFFLLFILPVAFFPFHKFPYSLAVPSFAISALIADAVRKLGNRWIFGICIIYLMVTVSSYQFNLKRHWNIRRADTTQAVFEYLRKNYPQRREGINIYFMTNVCTNRTKCPFFSQEVDYALNGMDGLRLFYNDQNLSTYYEDSDKQKNLDKDSIMLDATKFVRW